MGSFEYLLLFVAVILGLAVSDVAISVHRLLSAGRRVRWDWLAPLAALVAFLKIVTQWWSWFGFERLVRAITWEMFLAVLVGAVLLFLLSAAALPDEAPSETRIDLADHWRAVWRRYWILFLAHWLITNAVSIWAQMQIEGARLSLLQPAYLLGPVILSLVFIANRWWQTLCFAGLIVLYVGQFLGQSLAR
jgi:hypothetical protein